MRLAQTAAAAADGLYESQMRRLSNRTTAALVTLGLVLAVVVVAMAGQAPLSHPTPVDARSAQGPTVALVVLLLGVGILTLGALVTLAWSGRRRKDDPPERAPTPIEVSWIWKVVAILEPTALGAALIVAAVIGTRSARNTARFGSGAFGLAPPRTPLSRRTRGGFVLPSWLPWTALAILAVAVGLGLFALWRRRERTGTEASETAMASRAAVEAAIGALEAESDPRRAVIAAYAAMQRTLGERGVVRSPAEAPREYLERALVTSRATEREARTLTGLFEEARYSTHPIPERLREVALSALRSLKARSLAEGAQ